MKVKILGSAAAECMPALWCECATCKYARQHGGKDLRRRTSYLIDEDILVDLGPDFYWQTTAFAIDLSKITRLFFTHSHLDHLAPVELRWRGEGFSQVAHLLHVYGDEAIFERMFRELREAEHCPLTPVDLHLDIHPLQPGDMVKADDLEVLALPADHAPAEKPLLFLFRRGGKSLLIANDTGYFPEYAWTLLEGRKLDAVIIDCNGGTHPEYGYNRKGHSGAFTDEEIRKRLLGMGCLTQSAPFVLNHFSHNAHCLHHEMAALMEPRGLQVGFDGMEIEL